MNKSLRIICLDLIAVFLVMPSFSSYAESTLTLQKPAANAILQAKTPEGVKADFLWLSPETIKEVTFEIDTSAEFANPTKFTKAAGENSVTNLKLKIGKHFWRVVSGKLGSEVREITVLEPKQASPSVTKASKVVPPKSKVSDKKSPNIPPSSDSKKLIEPKKSDIKAMLSEDKPSAKRHMSKVAVSYFYFKQSGRGFDQSGWVFPAWNFQKCSPFFDFKFDGCMTLVNAFDSETKKARYFAGNYVAQFVVPTFFTSDKSDFYFSTGVNYGRFLIEEPTSDSVQTLSGDYAGLILGCGYRYNLNPVAIDFATDYEHNRELSETKSSLSNLTISLGIVMYSY